MKDYSNYHDPKTGHFVSREYAKKNPDSVVEVSFARVVGLKAENERLRAELEQHRQAAKRR
jgi:hypothetical protein